MLIPLIPELVIMITALLILMLDLVLKEKTILGYVSLFGVIIGLLTAISPAVPFGSFYSAHSIWLAAKICSLATPVSYG